MLRSNAMFWIASLLLAVPMAQAGTSTKKISNDKVIVTEQSLEPGEITSLSGGHPTLLVFFSGDTVEVMPAQGNANKKSIKRGDILFQPAGEDSIKNVGSSLLHFVRTEFLTEGNSETWGMAGLSPNYKMILENKYARTYDIKIPAQAFEPRHTHLDRIIICFSGAQLEHILPSGEKQPSTVASGEIAWRPGGTHIGHNLDHTDLWIIAIEPK